MRSKPVEFTPEATIGPFYPGIFVAQMPHDLTAVAPLQTHRPAGTPILVVLRFLDSTGAPVRSVIVETWQANAHGRYRHGDDDSRLALDPHFDGFSRLRTGDDGACELRTIKPGARAPRAPHIRLTVFASGIDRVVTQLFFDDESANDADPVLAGVSKAERDRLVAARRPALDREGALAYELTIRFRGERETPFFDDWATPGEAR